MDIRKIVVVPLSVVVVLILQAPDVLAEELQVRLRTNKHDYVLNEPVKLTASIVNMGDSRVRVPGISAFQGDIDFLFYEIQTPEREEEYRVSRYYTHVGGGFHREYTGEPLAPGDSLTLLLYPSYTIVRETGAKTTGKRGGRTFEDPGVYTVKLHYYVSDWYMNLWSGDVSSNEIDLEFRLPDDVEAEIVSAYWSDVELSQTINEMGSHARHDESRLRRVVTRYPDHTLVKYAYFALGRSYARVLSGNVAPDAEKAVPILEMLKHKYPSFRTEEVSKHLAVAYLYSGDVRASIRVFEQAIRGTPHVLDSPLFMKRYFRAKGGDSFEEYMRWTGTRKTGTKSLPFEFEIRD